MSINVKKTDQTVEFSNADGKPCGTYHYMDKFKSFFRGLYTPSGKDVIASPPREHPHHKGLQFGLCTSVANFWEEDKASEPTDNDREKRVGGAWLLLSRFWLLWAWTPSRC